MEMSVLSCSLLRSRENLHPWPQEARDMYERHDKSSHLKGKRIFPSQKSDHYTWFPHSLCHHFIRLPPSVYISLGIMSSIEYCSDHLVISYSNSNPNSTVYPCWKSAKSSGTALSSLPLSRPCDHPFPLQRQESYLSCLRPESPEVRGLSALQKYQLA
jgi:hypothetical protein